MGGSRGSHIAAEFKRQPRRIAESDRPQKSADIVGVSEFDFCPHTGVVLADCVRGRHSAAFD
jgi:hypothetical protein